MAISMTTFGNTLSELQAGANADKGLDYQRANAQDALNQQRLEAFLRLRGQQLETQARQSDTAAARTQRMAELLHQTQANRELAQMDAASRLEVAKATAEGRGDPRMYESFAEIQALNNENQNKINYAKQLSVARMNALKLKNDPMAPTEDTWGWGNAPYKKRVADAEALLKQLDTQAAALGLAPAADGGYVVPEFNPIPIPDFGRTVRTPVPVPVQTPVPEPVLPFAGGAFRGAGAGSTWGNPIVAPPSTNRFRWTPNGAVAY